MRIGTPTLNKDALAELVKQAKHLHGAVIEVGCWEGRSTVVIANACAPDRVLAVDTWLGSAGEECWEIAASRDVFSIFQHNIAEMTVGNVTPVKMDWQQFFAEWDGPIKFLHIDGEHSYEAVRANIEAALPHMVSGGVICGHDAGESCVMTAVRDVLPCPDVRCGVWYQAIGRER